MKRKASSVHSHSYSPQPLRVHSTSGEPSSPGRGPHTATPRYGAPSGWAPAPLQPRALAAGLKWFASHDPLHHDGVVNGPGGLALPVARGAAAPAGPGTTTDPPTSAPRTRRATARR